MAVVVSQSQGEIEELKAKGLDILPHRRRMMEENLASRFKDPTDRLRLVFVCAMWITGFDVPTCSTVYLDKPMKNHTLMQTIARANRTAPDKEAGTIVDYVGVFANLQDALAIYATPRGDAKPIRDKEALIAALEAALDAAERFCAGEGEDLSAILDADKLLRAERIGRAQEALIAPDERRRGFLRLADAALRAWRAVLPDERATPFLRRAAAIAVLAQAIRNALGPPDISALSARIEALLDANILGVDINVPPEAGTVDMSGMDFEALAAAFAAAPHAALERLRKTAEARVAAMAARNPTRADLIEKLEALIDAYNAASADAAETFEQLKTFLRDLDTEDGRAAREGLTEAELAIFDKLTQPEPKLTRAETVQVKKIARELLARLQDKLAVLHWRERQQPRADVHFTIEQVLNDLPEAPYPPELWQQKVEATWQFLLSRPSATPPH